VVRVQTFIAREGGAGRVRKKCTESRSRDTRWCKPSFTRTHRVPKSRHDVPITEHNEKNTSPNSPRSGLGEYRVRACGLNTVSRYKSTREKTLGLLVPKPGLARSPSKLEDLSKNLIKPLFAKFLSLFVSLEKKRRSVMSRNRDSTRPTYGIIKIEVKSVNFGHHAKKV
jgi:hypothetical protein